jgi:UDP-N-acetyl-D-galactosamine dehydrogenase
MKKSPTDTIVVIGLGYVGLPLAIALAKNFTVIGFDINEERINALSKGFDKTGEVSPDALRSSTLELTANEADISQKSVYIVTVPTPVTKENLPDLGPLESASKTVGKALGPGAIVIYESTVYPGVTEDFCGPLLESHSGLTCGKDFFLGYSPERINPGDSVHAVSKITKVISGQTPAVVTKLSHIYGSINKDNIFIAKNIKTAEAAKVIENTQRDINIAFINEVAIIMNKLGLSVYDVLDAANTKWNFLPFQPGLVGGHCIGVDPYYLAECAKQLKHSPEIILAGRHTNESMSQFLANSIHEALQKHSESSAETQKILILGLTFKENVPDFRNTKIVDLIHHLRHYGYSIDIHDPCADPTDVKQFLDIDLMTRLDNLSSYDCVIGAVPHTGYQEFSTETFQKLLKPHGLIADIKRLWRDVPMPKGCFYWCL